MAIIKCKQCGGDIEFIPGATYGTCEYCGTTSTIPKGDDEGRLNRFNRANHFRRQCEFDKALAAYEKLLESDDTDAEAHWGAVLSRYGIEYVEDPATGKRIPTCHRVSLTSILADADYKAAVENAPDMESRRLYEAQAQEIADIQKGILAISANEKPYDVFICYKETGDDGQRTHDSQWAQEIYYGLTEQGYKVFFSRITLEDKLGQQYEPYIFAALNSAKVMLVVGSKPEYFNAVWVKNEWSRYLALMQKDRSRLLIPCYRGMDPYDLPDELSNLQSQDMGKIGFMQDLLRGIKKVMDAGKQAPAAAPVVKEVVRESAAGTDPLLRRAFIFLEDGDFARADDFCEQVLNIDPENGRAYLGKLMAELKVRKEDDLKNQPQPFDGMNNYRKVMRFGDRALQAQVKGDIDFINERNELARQKAIYEQEQARQKAIYEQGVQAYRRAKTVNEFERAKRIFAQLPENDAVKERIRECDDCIERIYSNAYRGAEKKLSEGNYDLAVMEFQELGGYRDSADRAQEALERKRDAEYRQAEGLMRDGRYSEAETAFKNLGNYLDSAQRAVKARAALNERQERERRELEARQRRIAAKKRRRTVIVFLVIALAIGGYFAATKYFIPKQSYEKAVALRDAGKYEEAITAFEALEDFGDTAEQLTETKYLNAKARAASGDYARAFTLFNTIKGYKDVDNLLKSDDNLIAAAAALEAKFAVGNYVTFGSYPQTAAGTDSTPIEWMVLAREGNKALLLSRYGLDAKPYNTKWADITWEKSTLRRWLNGSFLSKAFSAGEQSAIEQTNVDNGSGQGYSKWSTNGGNNTQDKVFLLSYAEANQYLGVTYEDSNNMKSRMSPTAYADKNGAFTSNKTSEGTAAGWWWLRSPGSSQDYAARVYNDGSLSRDYVYYDSGCVRPALWVNLESGIF